jgi:hypothetical protein
MVAPLRIEPSPQVAAGQSAIAVVILVARLLPGGFASADAVPQQEVGYLLALRFPRDPNVRPAGPGFDEQSYGRGPVALLAGLVLAGGGGGMRKTPRPFDQRQLI